MGAEIKTSLNDVKGDRGDYSKEFLIGPSIQWRPLPHAHVDFAPLIGCTNDSPAAEIFLVLGWEF